MAKLKKDQPETLCAIVQFANSHLEIVPDGKQLAKLLKINTRAALKRRKTLVDKNLECFIIESKRRIKIDYDHLCTESKSATLLLLLSSLIEKSNNGKISKNEVFKLMGFNTKDASEQYLKALITAGYLQVVVADPSFLRGRSKLDDQKIFLQFLAQKDTC